jgi:voltage-dependent calcium channel L type alpha-1D
MFATKMKFSTDTNKPIAWEPLKFDLVNGQPGPHPHPMWSKAMPYDTPRTNFDDLLNAFLAVFQCLSGEDWNAVMYDGIRASGWSAAVYFIMLVIIGNFIVLNLFLAILLGNTAEDDEEEDEADGGKDETVEKVDIKASAKAYKAQRRKASQLKASDERRASRIMAGMVINHKTRATGAIMPVDDEDEDADRPSESSPSEEEEEEEDEEEEDEEDAETDSDDDTVAETACCVFSQQNGVRQLCMWMEKKPAFEHFIILCIIVSSICLAMDSPLNDPDSQLSLSLDKINLVLTVVFVVECAIRIMAHVRTYCARPSLE